MPGKRLSPVQNKIHVLRAEKKMTQKELGNKVGVSRQTINAMEKGRYTPSLALAFEIADAFGLSVTDVFHYQKGGIEDDSDSD
ncbi:helix-turn-helix transcriptional regulator [Rossellomorea sp. FS2]|uniref:helix-turn-helix transcriptional regulator n=1 Tax=Rossellomorea TaxID=2837508 RepID=UPI002079F34F|nr:helix-turn-helix transcriptional regulator [Rossellomorea marisflavi]USK91441.1 helix-turn-helix transcriptional regulator [Rossellomorea marisflavi]